jgi:dTDP-4-dehydrorhamnose 3,5-epimerase
VEIETTDIPGVVVARLRCIEDHRGFFSEIFSRRDFAGAGIATDFVQDNLSLSASPGTVRGSTSNTHRTPRPNW